MFRAFEKHSFENVGYFPDSVMTRTPTPANYQTTSVHSLDDMKASIALLRWLPAACGRAQM